MRRSFWKSLGLATVWFAITVWPAAAHAGLLRSDPGADQRLAAAPRQIVLWFDEELDTHASRFHILDADGQPLYPEAGSVDLYDPDHARMIAAVPVLPDGRYTVRWRVVSLDDGYATEGEFDFLVGDAEPRAKAAPVEAAPGPLLIAGLITLALVLVAGLASRVIKR
jgi:methionine-rich copper-binding protein CopC